MTAHVRRQRIAFATTRGASLHVIDADLSAAEVEEVETVLAWLVRQGQVAAFSIAAPMPAVAGRQGALWALRVTFGALTVEANLAAGPPPPEPPPAFLAAVWPFDHEVDGLPATTANFLGLDLELVASPSPSEEVGFALPGRQGLWLVRARVCSGSLGAEGDEQSHRPRPRAVRSTIPNIINQGG